MRCRRVGPVAVVAVLVVGLLGLGAFGLAAAAQAQPAAPTAGLNAPGWTTYSDRYGTRVDYPGNIFSVDEGAVPRGEGKALRSADGRARLLVYVEPNDGRYTPERFLRTLFTGSPTETDYKRITARFFVVSGVRDDSIYYSRCNFPAGRDGALHCIYLLYPRAEEKAWDGIVTRMSLGLKPQR